MDSSTVKPLPAGFEQARQAFSTRRVPRSAMLTLVGGALRPQAGQVLLARVVKPGQHKQLELISGRKALLYKDDRIIVAYGHRYAPDQFEALVPLDLGPCDLVAGGGVAARESARHADMSAPTRIEPLGLIGDAQGRPLHLRDFALGEPTLVGAWPLVLVVCGTSMNAGKTHTVAMLIRGLKSAGLATAACKVTGTGAGNDLWKMVDAGASPVLDFGDCGHASTYRVPLAELERLFTQLVAHCAAAGAQAVVVEIADGLGQAETSGLLGSETLAAGVDGVLFAAGDPLGALAGERWLKQMGLPLLAVSGLMTACALTRAEARALLSVPVLDAEQLAQGQPLLELLDAGCRPSQRPVADSQVCP